MTTARKKVLHIDDDEPTLRMVASHLEAAGFTVFSTTSPFIAPIITQERPDIIVMDVEMPHALRRQDCLDHPRQ